MAGRIEWVRSRIAILDERIVQMNDCLAAGLERMVKGDREINRLDTIAGASDPDRRQEYAVKAHAMRVKRDVALQTRALVIAGRDGLESERAALVLEHDMFIAAGDPRG